MWKSHADTGYRGTTWVESILNQWKPGQTVSAKIKENSAFGCRRNDNTSIFLEIASNKNTADDRKLRKKKNKIYAESVIRVETSNFDGEFLEQLAVPLVLKVGNHDFNRTVGIDFKKYIRKAYGR